MMDNDNSLNKRPTFKRALRNISVTGSFKPSGLFPPALQK